MPRSLPPRGGHVFQEKEYIRVYVIFLIDEHVYRGFASLAR